MSSRIMKGVATLSGAPINLRIKVFFQQLTWVMAGFAVARLITVAINLVAGRWLGPHEFGLYNLGLATGGALLPFISWGLGTATARYASADPAHRSAIYHTAFVLQSILLILGAVGVIIVRGALCAHFHIAPGVFWGGLGYAIGFALYLFGVSMSQVEGRFKERAVAEAGFAVIFAGAFCVLLFAGWRDYRVALYAMGASYLVIGLLLWGGEGKRWRGPFSPAWVLPLTGYGGLWMADMTSFFLQALFLRFVTNKFLSPSEVGVLSLYSLASISAAITFTTVFAAVFFPFASGHARRIDLWARLLSVSRRTFFPFLLGFGILQIGVILLAGKSYPFHPLLLGTMSLASVLCLFQSNVGSLLSAQGVTGYLWVASVRLGTSLAAGGAACWLVPQWGLLGAGVSYCLVFGAASISLLPGRRILLKESHRENSHCP